MKNSYVISFIIKYRSMLTQECKLVGQTEVRLVSEDAIIARS